MERQSNREIVFEAVKHDGLAREHAVVELHPDREFAREAVEPDELRLQLTAAELHSDREIVFETVVQDCKVSLCTHVHVLVMFSSWCHSPTRR